VYQSGLDLFNEAHLEHLPDGLHPDAEGYKIMAENYDRVVMRKLLTMLP
jgi:lysophospholipase L1-like esterase